MTLLFMPRLARDDVNPEMMESTSSTFSTSVDDGIPARWRRGSSERNSAACMLRKIRAGLDRRTRKVRRLRAAIRVGAYENDLKLHIAIDRLLGDIA